MTEIVETEHQGVRTVLAARTTSPKIVAGLTFRVGRVDETLPLRGITHLVEHLALHEHGHGDLHYNGITDDCFTLFHVEGTEAEVVQYLNGVCAELAELPMERLEVEKQILRTEADTRGGGPAPNMALYRHGAEGFGLASYDELGLANATPEALRWWVSQYFTRQNAVLWITSDRIPEGLDLRLVDGEHRPIPAPTSILDQTPAWFGGPQRLNCLHAVVPRSSAAVIFTHLLGRRMMRELRQESGLCYTANADYYPRDGESAVIWAVADADPTKQEAVVGGFIDVLAGLRFGVIEQAELDAAKGLAMRRFDDPDLAAHRLPGYAQDLLSGHENLPVAELVAEVERTTTEDMTRIAQAVWADALFQVPTLGLDWAGIVEAPRYSESVVRGETFSSLNQDGTSIVVGEDGVSFTSEHGAATVLFREVAAMLAWPDGARRIFGTDGFVVTVEPSIHPATPPALSRLDAAVPADLVVRMPARPADQVPQPDPEAHRRRQGPTPASSGARTRRNLSAVIFALLAVLFVATGISGFFETDPETGTTDVGTAVTCIVMGVGFGVLAWWLRRRATQR